MVDRIEILDTTLRDGEQTSGVSFTVREKLSIARLLLDELHVDRIEVASARVSDGEFESVRRIARWARNAVFSTGWRFWVSSTAEFRCGGSPMPDAA